MDETIVIVGSEVLARFALDHENVKPLLVGKTVVKIIAIPNKVVNIIVK